MSDAEHTVKPHRSHAHQVYFFPAMLNYICNLLFIHFDFIKPRIPPNQRDPQVSLDL